MKKLLLLGLLTLSSNLFSMEEQTQPKPTPKTQLSRWEKAKIGAAMLGCAFFTWSVFLNRNLKAVEVNKKGYSWYHAPSIGSLVPLALFDIIYECFTDKTLMEGDLAHNTSAIYSTIFAALCGAYIYKKLKQPAQISGERA